MAKRFTATNKWEDAWFMELQSRFKLLWLFLLDRCSHAGIWEVNLRVASFFIGDDYSLEESLRIHEGRVFPIVGGKYWFIPKFVKYQYGELSANSRPHLSVIKELESFSLIECGEEDNYTLCIPLPKGTDTHIDKDKVKDKDKVFSTKLKEKKIIKEKKKGRFKKPSLNDVVVFFKKGAYIMPVDEGERFWRFYESKGWMVGKNRMRNWQVAAGNWNSRRKEQSAKEVKKVYHQEDSVDGAW